MPLNGESLFKFVIRSHVGANHLLVFQRIVGSYYLYSVTFTPTHHLNDSRFEARLVSCSFKPFVQYGNVKRLIARFFFCSASQIVYYFALNSEFRMRPRVLRLSRTDSLLRIANKYFFPGDQNEAAAKKISEKRYFYNPTLIPAHA